MENQGILVVSFGTSYKEAKEKGISSLEKNIKSKFADTSIYRAYTSNIVRKVLARRGEVVDSVEEALVCMKEDGIKKVFVQPTHLIYGEEYEKIRKAVSFKAHMFDEIKVGEPLLGDTKDMKKIAHILHQEYPIKEDECLVLMGHGTKHFCNTVYAAMEYICHEQGFKNIYMGTVEAYPDVDIVIRKLKADGRKKVTLIPFMLVAGNHAINDMAGDIENSWVNRFRNEGFETKVILKGLGEYKKIRELYCQHIKII